ncbi:MAG: DUF2723 domain-containing protein, partial [Candidatus Levybacteria bacterium]|nr:DUF2723 domain-containing protein [Candidatus Levybacteria bacterium]
MATTSAVYGVSHPPGYPLFTLLGIIFVRLPIEATVAWKFSLVSLISAIIALFFFYKLLLRLGISKLLSMITLSILAFTYAFWLYAEVVEVFSLYYLFFILLFYLGFSFYQTKQDKYLYLLSFFIGLSLSHQQAILILFPALFLMVFFANKKVLINPGIILKCIGFVVIGLLPYFYLPISYMLNPPITWLTELTPSALIQHVLRLNYGWVTSATTPLSERVFAVITYFTYWLFHLPLILILTSLIGAAALFVKKRKLFVLISLAFFISGPLFVFYAATSAARAFTFGVLERFYVSSYIMFLLFFPFGVLEIVRLCMKAVEVLLKKKVKSSLLLHLPHALTLLFIIIPVSLFFTNSHRIDMSEMRIGEYYALDILNPLPKKSIVFADVDTTVFPTHYVQYVLGVRRDILMPSFSQLQQIILRDKRYSKVYKEILKNERYARDSDYVIDTALSLRASRPVFSPAKVKNTEYSGSFVWMPYGLVYKAVTKNEIPVKEEYIRSQELFWERSFIDRIREYRDAPNLPLVFQEI